MDLMASILITCIIYLVKAKNSKLNAVNTSITDLSGEVSECVVRNEDLVIGTNLFLKKEPRAYHKIIDDLGLSWDR